MDLTFEKWEDGRWFVVLPDYDGPQEDLEMVDGADKFLDVLTTDGLYVNVEVSLEYDPDMYHLHLVKHDELGGTIFKANRSSRDTYLLSLPSLPPSIGTTSSK